MSNTFKNASRRRETRPDDTATAPRQLLTRSATTSGARLRSERRARLLACCSILAAGAERIHSIDGRE